MEWASKGKEEEVLAMLLLGNIYETGLKNMENDQVKALEWYKKAAEKDSQFKGAAIYEIAHYYESGLGDIQQDKKKAIDLYTKSFEAGYTQAAFTLALLYDILYFQNSESTEYKKEALNWYLKAANKNHSDAMFAAAEIYIEGAGDFLKKIEKNGSKIYIERFFELYENGKLKSSYLHKGTTVKTEIGELFAGKGEITFWEDGSIKSFTNDDTIIETIAGMKVSIPSGTRMSIYKSGKIRSFYVTNEIQFKLGANTYTTIKGDTNFPFVISEDGNILSAPAIKWDNNKDGNILGEKIAVESFDSKFEPCIIYDLYTGYKYLVYNRKILASFSEQPFLYQTHDAYLYYQPGDTGENIWMVYFDSKGIPSTYCVYDKITGERNTEKKKFVRKQ